MYPKLAQKFGLGFIGNWKKNCIYKAEEAQIAQKKFYVLNNLQFKNYAKNIDILFYFLRQITN